MNCPACTQRLSTAPGTLYCSACGARVAEPATAPLWILDRNSNLFNRHFMAATLEQESARSQRYSRPLSFLLVEIDESALEYAPNLLQDLRSALSGVLRDTDTLGHWGPAPTRFAIILPETPPAGAANILSRLQTVPLISGHLHLGLSGTLGTTTTPLDLPALAEASLLATAS